MNAMILAAGLGTRLKPWTLEHPKALVPVEGEPMLGRVIKNLIRQGFDYIVVNVHHFADQIVDYLAANDFGVEIAVSDESGVLLDTGGGLVKAEPLLRLERGPVLVHNVDILSNADLHGLMMRHEELGGVATMLVSDRESGRKLIFDREMRLRGWHNLSTGEYRPEGFRTSSGENELAFSGIHVVSGEMISEMKRINGVGKFPVMDYYLSPRRIGEVYGYCQSGLKVLDIGKPASLTRAGVILCQL